MIKCGVCNSKKKGEKDLYQNRWENLQLMLWKNTY